MVIQLNTKEIITEAKRLQREIGKTGDYWSLEACTEAICEKDCFVMINDDKRDAIVNATQLDYFGYQSEK